MIQRFAPLLLLLLLVACNDPTLVGEQLLNEDAFDVQRTDTVTLYTNVRGSDTLVVYDDGARISNFFVGNFDDPAFGRTEGQLYAQLRPEESVSKRFIVEGATIDSVILRVVVDEANSYGDINVPYTFELYELDEQLDPEAAYTAEDVFMTKAMPLSTLTVTPGQLQDSIELIRYTTTLITDTLRVNRHLRFDLTSELSDILLNTPNATLENDTLLSEIFPGFNIRVNGDNPGLVDLRLRADIEPNGLAVYYTRNDTTYQYDFSLTAGDGVRTANYVQDISGSPVETYLENDASTDSLAFIQGLNGVLSDISFPFVEDFPKNVQINRAELILRVAFLSDDGEMLYDLPEQMILAEVDEDGNLSTISDLANFLDPTGVGFSGDVGFGFGGQFTPGENGEPGFYRFNISQHFAEMIRGGAGTNLQISQASRAARVNRVIFYGGGHPQYAPELTVTFTNF